jgi:hypothetical protein
LNCFLAQFSEKFLPAGTDRKVSELSYHPLRAVPLAFPLFNPPSIFQARAGAQNKKRQGAGLLAWQL